MICKSVKLLLAELLITSYSSLEMSATTFVVTEFGNQGSSNPALTATERCIAVGTKKALAPIKSCATNTAV